MQYEVRVVQCEKKVYSTRFATSAIGGQSLWYENKVLSLKCVMSGV